MSVFSPRDFAEMRPGDFEGERNQIELVIPSVLQKPTAFPERAAQAVSGKASVRKVSWPFALIVNRSQPQAPLGGVTKRAFDIVVASAALVALAPLFLILAAAIKARMGGPILYSHERIGFGGRRFRCLKFRTMVTDSEMVLQRHLRNCPHAASEWRLTRKLANDPRITGLGAFLRKTSLDELPQFINILRGDMSCVGPRPIVADELELYKDKLGEYLQARPGITGLWQISGRSSASYDTRVCLDFDYVRRWSFSRDLVILVRTLPAVLKFDDAV